MAIPAIQRGWRYIHGATDHAVAAPIANSDGGFDSHADQLAKAVATLCDELARLG